MNTKTYVWDTFVRVFHWSLVCAFAVAFLTRDSEWYRLIHVRACYAPGILIMLRVFWGIFRHGYANFSSFPFSPKASVIYVWQLIHGKAKRFIGHNPAGSLMIYGLLSMGIITVTSGILVYNDGWLINQPELLQMIHQWAAWSWLTLVGLHVLGVVAESIFHHDNLILAMITGYKRRSKRSERDPKNRLSKPKKQNHVSRETSAFS